MAHWFWTLLVILVILWYVIVTAIVTLKGGQDIFTLLSDLEKEDEK